MSKTKILFIGGHPKGHEEAFSPETHSGKILWGIVGKLGLTAHAYDLWENEIEEKKGYVLFSVREELQDFRKQGYTLISLGRHVHNSLLKRNLVTEYAPHPARHSKALEARLLEFAPRHRKQHSTQNEVRK